MADGFNVHDVTSRVDAGMSTYLRYQEELDRVPAHSRATVDRLCSQAISYVWGFQDAGGEVKDTDRSTEFGYAYGLVAAYRETRADDRPPIQDAWRCWQEHGEIRNWKGERLGV